MEFKYLIYDKKGRIAHVTLNRPEVLNALHPPLLLELDQVWSDYIGDPHLWVAILTGSGDRAFSAGADLKYRVEEADEGELRSPGGHEETVLARCRKPVIAAVNGYAVGGGLELALNCDIVIAAEHAKFGLPEARRGLLADAGGVIRLPRRIPYHLAMGLLLTGSLISAQEAYRMGLVNEVVPMAELLSTAQRWANEIMQCAPLAVQAAKHVATKTLDLPHEVAMGLIESLDSVRRLRESEDYAEGPKAFAEKRKPVWRGK